MIQIYTLYCNQFYQKIYNEFTESLNFNSLSCSACYFQGQCTRHVFYTRNIVTESGVKKIRILRVKCSHWIGILKATLGINGCHKKILKNIAH